MIGWSSSVKAWPGPEPKTRCAHLSSVANTVPAFANGQEPAPGVIRGMMPDLRIAWPCLCLRFSHDREDLGSRAEDPLTAWASRRRASLRHRVTQIVGVGVNSGVPLILGPGSRSSRTDHVWLPVRDRGAAGYAANVISKCTARSKCLKDVTMVGENGSRRRRY
jgi:hypothetical protein